MISKLFKTDLRKRTTVSLIFTLKISFRLLQLVVCLLVRGLNRMLALHHLVLLTLFVVSRMVAMKRCSVVDQLASAGV